MAEHRLQPERFIYTYGPTAPALRVRSGDTVIAETRDARGLDRAGVPLRPEMKQASPDTNLRESNPLVGPIYVEGAEPGDLLAVHVEAIRLTRPWAWSRHNAHFGALTGEALGIRLLLNPPQPEAYFEWRLDLEAGIATLAVPKSRVGEVAVPLDPFIGSIGVAPRWGRVETALTPGEFGGNMDCPDVREGSTLLLPVWVRGAYLAFGDVHAAQGDGELCGSALETTAEVTLRLEVLKGKSATWPRAVDGEWIITMASTRPLDDALRAAVVEIVEWLATDYGYDRTEALQVLSQAGRIRVANFVDPQYTVACRFPRRLLPEG